LLTWFYPRLVDFRVRFIQTANELSVIKKLLSNQGIILQIEVLLDLKGIKKPGMTGHENIF